MSVTNNANFYLKTTGDKDNIDISLSLQGKTVSNEPKFDEILINGRLGFSNENGFQNGSHIQPSVHFGIMPVQSNAPDDGLSLEPQFVNAAAHWVAESEIVWSYRNRAINTHNWKYCNAEDFIVYQANEASTFLNTIHFMARECFQ